MTDEPDAPTAYSLAELAAVSGVSERTIRYYQAEHLLPRPTKHGRDAVYADEHRQRLLLIAELRDRGLTLHTITDLVANRHPARTVSEWLGVDATLSAPWSDDRPATLTHGELIELVAQHGIGQPGVIGQLHTAGYVELQPDGGWLLPSPMLVDQALRLHQAGIQIEVSALMRDLLRRRLSKAVDDTVKLLVSRTGSGFAGDASPHELAAAIGALRPITREMSGAILAQEVERALAGLLRSGPESLRRSRRR